MPCRVSRRLALAVLALAGSAVSAVAQAPRPLHVVATFSILGDLVAAVGGDRVAVTTLVQPEGDAHVYEPTPADAQKLSGARVIVTNGLGFEGWLDRLIASSGTKARIVVASSGVKPKTAEDEEHAAGIGRPSAPHFDPHAWQNVANVKIYVANIRDALADADPEGRTLYEANAQAYAAKLEELDAAVKSAVAAIPRERRRIITSHDAFGYFAEAYGLKFIAPQGVSTDTEASARDVGRIIAQIKREKIPAVFVENVSNPRLIQRIAKETGAAIGEKVYSDALSAPSGPAGTYITMMRHNITAFTKALAR